METCWESYQLDYPAVIVGRSLLVCADCLVWLRRIPEQSIHAVVTDPPYGVKEYQPDQLDKRANGQGGTWRLPPAFDGANRAPLPRFTALNAKERTILGAFFTEWARCLLPALRPGAHVFLASNAFLAQLTFAALTAGGLEYRGSLIRLVQTFRGGDRPKGAEADFPQVQSLPRSHHEPWGIFRKPLPPGMRVQDCLREYGTGGLRRAPDGRPFPDVILSGRTPQRERALADHPSLKPQAFLRQVVYAALPLGEGVLADPFAGAGSTIAACEALGISSIGVEQHPAYYDLARRAAPALAALSTSAPDGSPVAGIAGTAPLRPETLPLPL